MAHAPKLISETFHPVRPKLRYFMGYSKRHATGIESKSGLAKKASDPQSFVALVGFRTADFEQFVSAEMAAVIGKEINGLQLQLY
jgi:hypothetical protein